MIRRYRENDLPALSAICYDTALFGRPIAPLVRDRALVAEALIGYYVRCEKESLFVSETEGRATGYLAGCVDTSRFSAVFARRIAPRVAARWMIRGHWLRAGTWRLLAALVSQWLRRRRYLRSIVPLYPAHCHINVAEGARRSGAGAALLGAFTAYLAERKVGGVHVATPTEAGTAFFERAGFRVLATLPAPSLRGVPLGTVRLMGKKLL